MDITSNFGFEKIKELKQKRLDALKDAREARNKLRRLNKQLETAVSKQAYGERFIRQQISLQNGIITSLEREVKSAESELLSDSWRPAVIR